MTDQQFEEWIEERYEEWNYWPFSSFNREELIEFANVIRNKVLYEAIEVAPKITGVCNEKDCQVAIEIYQENIRNLIKE